MAPRGRVSIHLNGITQSFLHLGVSNFVNFNLICFWKFLAPVADQIKSADLLIRSAIIIK